MSLRQFARVSDLPATTVWRAIHAIDLKPYRVGMAFYITWSDVERLEAHLSERRQRRGAHSD